MVRSSMSAGQERLSDGSLSRIAATKIVPPATNRFRVARPRLLDALQAHAARRLTLLKAPAGSGKTTLAVDWCEQLRRCGAVIAWLSIDEDDNEPGAFAYHIASTLHRAAPWIGQSAIDLLAETKLIATRSVAAAALNAAADSDEEIYLFLDDYHLISDERPHDFTAFLLRYAPSNFHLAILSRTEPPLPVLRLLLADDVAEIDVASLRFTFEETRSFLRAEQAPTLNDQDIEKLHQATEGWPAALQLARITVRNSPDLPSTIRSFSGASRKISAYIEDTLATQPDEVIEFLLQTAILERLYGPLCHAVTGIARSAELLKALDHEQLLLVTLDEREGWYRYHHLMGDFLLDRLNSRAPDKVPELHRRAHRWFASQEMWTQAVQHAIAARDFGQALQYVEQCAMQMVVKGDLLTLVSWERKLPVEMMNGQVEVKLALAWSFILVTRFAEGAALLSQVEEAADEGRTPDLWWRCKATRGVLAAMSDDSEQSLALGTACQGQIQYDPFYRNALCNVLRFGCWKSGKYEAFYTLPKPAISDGEATYVLAEQYRLCLYGMVAAQRLQSDEALARYAEARQLIEKYAGRRSAAAAIPTGLSALLRYEAGDVSGAEIAVLDELDLIETSVFHESFLAAHLVMARAAYLRDDLARVVNVLERGRELARERGWDRLVAAFLLEQARFTAGRVSAAELRRIVEEIGEIRYRHPAPTRCSWSDIEIAGIACEGVTVLAASRPAEAAQLLQQAYDAMLLVDDRYGALRVGIDLAVARHRAGDLIEGNRIASQVMSAAAAAGAVSFALERSAEFVSVLTACLKYVTEPHTRQHAEHLLSRCRERESPGNSAGISEGKKQLLTERERSIVQFIAVGQSNKQIARTIGVTPETVKTHVKRIFVKLSAESRTQAVVRAQSLGLLRDVEIN